MNSTKQQMEIRTFWEGQYLKTVEQNILTFGKELIVEGFITGLDQNRVALNVHYAMSLSSDWHLISTAIVKNGTDLFSILKSDGKWIVNNQERSDLADCVFIDINISPFTNSLPINQLDFNKSAEHKIKVVFVDVLQQEVDLSNQRYAWLDDTHYTYKNLDSGFTRTIEVDRLGLVVAYPGIWKRIHSF